MGSYYGFTKGSPESVQTERLAGQVQLKDLGLQAEGGRQMTRLQTISASWVICDSWAGVAGTIALAISQGGPTTLLYGPILMLFLVGSCVLTMAELASVYPTAGGQYHWTSILSPEGINRSVVCPFHLTAFACQLLLINSKSYCCGMTNVFSWIAICTGIAIIPAQLVVGIALFYNPDYTPVPWHYFLIYQAINGCVLLYNITLLKRSLWIHDVSCEY